MSSCARGRFDYYYSKGFKDGYKEGVAEGLKIAEDIIKNQILQEIVIKFDNPKHDQSMVHRTLKSLYPDRFS
ncbi:MAG: hypothetical protein PWP27_205 [Clostridiales bacterium]|nr:hypothetical protein [Clostridiales bacterium]